MNADNQWYRTGAVAKMLGTSPHRIRALARAGVIESQRRENGFLYVPHRELERLQAEGLPPLPATAEFSEGESSDDEESPAIPAEIARRPLRSRHDELYSEASPGLAKSKEAVIKLEHSAAAQQLRRGMRQTSRAEREEETRVREDQEARQWRNEYLRMVAHSVPAEVCADACGQVKRLLDSVPAGTDLHQRVAELIDAVQRPIRERQQQERDHAAHVERIETFLRSIRVSNSLHETKDDRDEARERARAALAVLPIGSAEHKLRTTADAAIEPVRERIRRKEAQQEHRSRVQSVLVSMHIPGADWNELQEARELAGDALAAMPVGSSERQLRDRVAEAIRRVVERSERRVAEEDGRRKAEARKFQIQLFLFHLKSRIDDRLGELERAEEVFFDDYFDRQRVAGSVEKKIEPLLRAEIERNPQLSDADLRGRIARLVDEHYLDFCDDDEDEDDE
jgi:DNA-binding transcriptional MerR regulator